MDFEIVIKNGHILDGTGNPWFRADIGIDGGKITKLSLLPLKEAPEIIDAKGLMVCPGFINLHSHSDSTVLSHSRAENCLAMGLVTELVGNCGTSSAPITRKQRRSAEEMLKARTLLDDEVDWLTLDEWIRRLEMKGIGINVAPLAGHGTVRTNVLGAEGAGGEKIVPSNDELDKMKGIVDEAMKDGAFGLSTGLIYAPGRNALTEEVVELAKVVARYGGVYASHMRCEGDQLLEATQEFIDICERAGVRGTIAHHKASGRNNFGKVSETIRMVERARARGIDIIIDQYPWTYGGVTKSLGARFRPDVVTREELVKKLKDEGEWEKLRAGALKRRDRELALYEERKKRLEEKHGWTAKPYALETGGTIIYSKKHHELEGKSLKEVAESFGASDIWEGIRKLLIEDDGWTCAGGEPYSEDDIVTILKYPWTTVSTDQNAWDNSKVSLQAMADALSIQHPRGWGTYPKILGKYVREDKVLTLEDAVRKMTSLPARFLGLQERGIIRRGFWADLVLFDPNRVGSVATYGNPCLYPQGIPYVLVNGKLAIRKGKPTGTLDGKVLRYNA